MTVIDVQAHQAHLMCKPIMIGTKIIVTHIMALLANYKMYAFVANSMVVIAIKWDLQIMKILGHKNSFIKQKISLKRSFLEVGK